MVTDVIAQDIGDAGRVAGSSTHPEDVVVAPLDVQRMMMHERVHDLVGMSAAVVDIADDVQVVDGQPFDEIGQSVNELARTSRFQDGVENLHVIDQLVLVFIGLGVQEFIDNEAEDFRHGFTDFRPRIFRRQELGQVDHPFQRRPGPVIVDLAFAVEHVQLFLRIINKSQQVVLFGLAHLVRKNHFHFFADDAGAVVEDVIEGFVFTVQVTHEVFCPFRQVDDGLQIDDFRERRRLRGILLGQELQIAQIFRGIGIVRFHVAYLSFLYSICCMAYLLSIVYHHCQGD